MRSHEPRSAGLSFFTQLVTAVLLGFVNRSSNCSIRVMFTLSVVAAVIAVMKTRAE